jgi:hypothetical protein
MRICGHIASAGRRVSGGVVPPSLLLDVYPNAAASYSLRKLRSAYTGDAIRVRRDNDNAEQDIGFVNNELDTASLLAFVGANNGFVTTWYDQSGNGHDATQTNAAEQPKIYDSITGVVLDNGKPALDFDGSNDCLNFGAIGITGNIARSIFSVATSRNISIGVNGNPLLSIGDGTTAANRDKWEINHEFSLRVYGGSVVYAGGVINTQYLTSNIFPTGSTNVIDNKLYVNSVIKSITGTGSAIINTNDTVNRIGSRSSGTSLFLNGLEQEQIIYASDQSVNRVGIETNINDFYSIYP